MADAQPADARVQLRKTRRGDLQAVMSLWNDGRVTGWVGFPDGVGYDPDRMAAWWERLRADPTRHHFVIEVVGIGFCGEAYYAVDGTRAGLDIKLRPEAQGQGIAATALRALVARIFSTEPAVEALWAEPARENVAARRLYARCGLAPAPRPDELPPGDSYWELRRGTHQAGSVDLTAQ